MSVVVLGMEMPESCSSCDFFYDAYRCTQLNYNFYYEDGEPNVFAERLPDCPLRPLPEKHGRLIDDSRLRETFGMGERCDECKQDKRDCQYYQIFTRMDFCGWLDDMETIVEAEGENDG